MIRDLLFNPTTNDHTSCDILVVGAGTAGLILATRLARGGRRVIVVESGDHSQSDDFHPLNRVEQLGDIYSGAEHGRFRCLGGTSTRWGGAMIPFQAVDLTDIGDWISYQRDVEQLFGLADGPYDLPDLMPNCGGTPAAFTPRLAKWPAFQRRNVASLLEDEIKSDRGPEIWLNATATDFHIDPGGRLTGLTVQAKNGRTLSVASKHTVLAAGAIESTRILLLADRQYDERIFTPDGILGRYFYDHLSTATARLVNVDRKELNRITGFRFEGDTMRNLRFETNAHSRADQAVPAAFVHIAFATEKATGFDALRDVYRKLQRRERPALADVAALAASAPWLVRAAWWRLIEKRLLFPPDARLDVHVVIEQEPRRDNYISLSSRECDPFGYPIAALNWHVSDADATRLVTTTEVFLNSWNSCALSQIAKVQLNLPSNPKRALAEGGGIFHPGGSIRIGDNRRSGVVDADLRTFQIPNLSVVSTATFPTGGAANPTMMLMMSAMRTADRLLRTSDS